MPKKVINSPAAPKAIGPYSQALECAGHIFLSGNLPLDPVTGEITGGDVKTQTERVIKNIEIILKEAGLTLKDVVKTSVFMTDLTFFAEMNGVYGEFFKEPAPARTVVQVVALPKGAAIEIEAVAIKEKK